MMTGLINGYCHDLFELYYWLFPWLKNFYSSYCSDLTCDQCLRPAGPTNNILKVKLPVVVSFM